MTTPEQRVKLTKRVVKVMHLAQQEAVRMGQNTIETEHLLIGILHEHGGLAVHILHTLGVRDEQVYQALERTPGRSIWTKPIPPASLWQRLFRRPRSWRRSNALPLQQRADGWDAIRFAPAAKNSIALAYEEAEHLHHAFVGTEHLLYGLVTESDSLVATLLRELGVDAHMVEAHIPR